MAVWAPYYNTGQEGFLAAMPVAASPSSADGISAPSLGSSLALVGYSNSLGFSETSNTIPIRSAGSPRALAHLRQRREFTITGSVVLSSTAVLAQFLRSALRDTTVGATVASGQIAAASRYQCLPMLHLAFGAVGQCLTGRDRIFTGYFAMFNSLVITLAENQPPTAQFEIWPMAISKTASPTLPTISDAALITAGGVPYGFQHLGYSYSGQASGYTDMSPGMTGMTISINNNLRRGGTRHYASGDDFSQAARVIKVGDQVVTTTLQTTDPLPDDGTALGTATAAITDGTTTLSIITTLNARTTLGLQPVETNGDHAYTAELDGSAVTITNA
jgi:hypothetical protein